MKKILYIITHLEMGGAQKHLLSLIRGLDKSTFEAYLYCGRGGFLQEEFEAALGGRIVKDRFLIREINPFFDLASLAKMFFFIRRSRFDIVHTHSPKASALGRWAAFFAGVRNIIYTAHGWPFHGFLPKMWFYLFLGIEKITAKITKKVIVVSRYDLFLAGKYRIAPQSKLKLVHYGLNINSYKAVSSQRKDKVFFPLIITAGALKQQKGLLDFIAAAKLILRSFPQSRFLIVGDGPERQRLAGQIKNKGLENRIILPGWLKDLRPLYQQASLFMLASLWEGLPLSLIEAVFCGLPAVVTDTGGVWDIAGGQQSIRIVEKGNWSALASEAIYILRNYSYFSRMAKESSLRIEGHYWSEGRQQEEVESLYL